MKCQQVTSACAPLMADVRRLPLVAANLLAAPSILGGTDYTAFWSAPGYVTFFAQVAMVI